MRPFLWIATVNRRDVLDLGVNVIIRVHVWAHQALSRTESGRVRWYTAVVGIGAALLLGVAVFR